MSNKCFDLLYDHYSRGSARETHLWLAGEALTIPVECNLFNSDNNVVLSNRWPKSQNNQKNFVFNDCDLSVVFNQWPVSRIYAAIPKEKAQLNFILNQAAQFLPEGGCFLLAGTKNQGIKSVAKNAKALFGQADSQKYGNLYLITLVKTHSSINTDTLLDDQQYSSTRAIFDINDKAVYSKPGVFGWNKIDPGSELLLSCLKDTLSTYVDRSIPVLDLGCGYGYLILSAAELGFTQLFATDNNAAALQALEQNTSVNSLNIQFWPDHIGQNTDKKFDLVLCNPPFHQGFEHDKTLTAEFTQQMAKLTSGTGKALVVTNQFIGIEAIAKGYFTHVTELKRSNGFKVVELKR